MTLPAPNISTGNLCEHVSATFTRPNDTTAYTSGDLVANNTTAGSVTPLTFNVGRGSAGGMIRRIRIVKSGTTTTNATFRLHLYSASPTPANGDNGAWSTDKAVNYQGYVDVAAANTLAFTDGTAVIGSPAVGTEFNFAASPLYGLLEVKAAYTPAAQEVFTVMLEVVPN